MSAFVACGDKQTKTDNASQTDSVSLAGQWLTSSPNDSASQMGVELKDGGAAASVNMPTLPYDKWQKVDDSTLVIHGVSIFDGNKTELNDTFRLDAQKATLSQLGTDIVYEKQ